MKTIEGALARHLVGVRHLSPAGAVHLRTLLDRVSPTAVLVEAPAGVETEMRHLAHPDTRPPVALLAFTKSRPLRSIVYPLASYSPEWVACRWALEKNRELVFIDLPAPVFLALSPGEDEADDDPPAPDVLAAVAREAEAPDLETWWERSFEHTADEDSYVQAALALGAGLRSLQRFGPRAARENTLRESFMRRRIRETLGAGHSAERIVVVCGAFHAPVLVESEPTMDDATVRALPQCEASVTLMPYSYARLHSRSGYGAGNHAPSYYQALHAELEAGHPERLAARFLARVSRKLRREGNPRSPAQVIDAVQLARALAALAGSPAVTLADLRDAAIACLGAGEHVSVAAALDEVETGTAIGRLPEGVSRTALQDDFRRELAELGLDRQLGEKPTALDLDLREDRYAKGERAAFLDRDRSVFLHRLVTSGLPLAAPAVRARDSTLTSWRERWTLRWSPELELRLAEASLLADTVAGLASHVLSEELAACRDSGSAAAVLVKAARCRLADALESARSRLQAVAVEDDSIASVASAVVSLLAVTRFGGVRSVDPEALWPLCQQLYLRGVLLIPSSVSCDDVARDPVRDGLASLALAAAGEPGRLSADDLAAALRSVALSDAGNPYLAGFATALLLERMQLDDGQLARSLGRRLSPGEDVDLAAGYFEGLTGHNRMALFSRPVVWENLSRFVDALDGRDLLRALVPLRRAFGVFGQAEIRRVVSALGEHWAGGAGQLARAVETRLSPEEVSALNEQLGDLDDLEIE